MHGVEAQAKAAADQGANRREIKQRFHQFGIVGHRVDHFHLHVAHRLRPQPVEHRIGRIDDAVAIQRSAAGKDRVGDFFRRRPAVAGVVLDAEVALRPTGIVAGGKNQAAEAPVLADHAGGGRRRQNAALPHQNPAKAVGGGHFENDLGRLAVVVAPVAAQHQRAARRCIDGVEHRLDEVFQISRRLEYGDLLAQARGARFLVGEGSRGDGSDAHKPSLLNEVDAELGSSLPASPSRCPSAVKPRSSRNQ